MARPSSPFAILSGHLAWLLACGACTSEFPLGAWGNAGGGGRSNEMGGSASVGGEAGASSSGGSSGCQVPGTVGKLNAPGNDFDVTSTSTDFTWPTTLDATEIELVIETDADRDGYFWAYQFSLSGSAIGGFVGVQANGGYQAVPPNGEVEVTSMAVFWIGGAPLKAELGDIAFPRARTYQKVDSPATSSNPTTWWTIHAKYPLTPCRPYRLRVARSGQEASGDIWYSAYIRDVQASSNTYLGRILVPAAWGAIRTTSAFTDRIGWGTPTSCSYPEYASGRFGLPSGGDGAIQPLTHSNRFATLHCGTSRFTELTSGVRHELGVP